MRRWFGAVFACGVALALVAAAAAQNPASGNEPGAKPSTSGSSQAQPHKPEGQQSKKEKHEKSGNAAGSEEFSAAVANALLQRIADGLVGHNLRQMLSAFDQQKMSDYGGFRDQVDAFFVQYESFRVYFRVLESGTENAKGAALVEVELEGMPNSSVAPAVRKAEQLQFEFERGANGWKIVDLHPREFFS